jgi:tetratricopeptide (TPR) repeat protein
MTTPAALPENPAQRYGILIRRLTESTQWQRLLETAREWLEQDPESADAHLAAGQALVNLRRYEQAPVHLQRVLTLRPRHAFAHRLASIAAFHRKKPAEAEEHVRQALALQPEDSGHWYHLAWMRYRQGALETAERHARHSLSLNPNDADTINLIAICQGGNPKAQLAQYLRALELDPENSVVHNNLGTYYLNSVGDKAAAEASFRRALQLNPEDEISQRNLLVVLRSRDRLYRTMTAPQVWFQRYERLRGGPFHPAKLILIFFGLYLMVFMAFWLLLFMPLVKAYEFLTLGDLRAKAGVVGARRGGWLGYRRWPLLARFAIFVGLAAAFWSTVGWLIVSQTWSPEWVYGMIGGAIISLTIASWPRRWKRWRNRRAARRGEKMLRRAGPLSPSSPPSV